MGKTAIGFLVAPLWVPVAVGTYAALYLFPQPEQSHWIAIATVISAIFGYAGTFVLGLPALLVLRSCGQTAAWISIAGGLIGGILTWTVFGIVFGLSLGNSMRFIIINIQDQFTKNIEFLLQPGLLGALVGLTWWLIARPDRSNISTNT